MITNMGEEISLLSQRETLDLLHKSFLTRSP